MSFWKKLKNWLFGDTLVTNFRDNITVEEKVTEVSRPQVDIESTKKRRKSAVKKR